MAADETGTRPNVVEYWNSRHEAPGLAAVGHLRLGEPYNRWLYRVKRRAFQRTVGRLFAYSSPGDVLDVGSGKGFYIERWKELRASSIAGADLSAAAVDGLRSRFPGHEIMQLDIGAPLDERLARRYDVISIFDVLYHVIEDDSYRRAFHNLAMMLRPGGHLVFSEYMLEFPETRRGKAWVKRPRTEVEATVREAGLQLVGQHPTFFLMNPPADPTPTLHRRSWRKLTQQIRRRPAIGGIAGAVLYPFEILLGATRSEGPSTGIFVCRKPA